MATHLHLALELSNGITLCGSCHRAVHKQHGKPKRKQGELLGSPSGVISSQAEVGTSRKVQRLGAESRTDGNAPTSALRHVGDDIVRAVRQRAEGKDKEPCR